MQSCPDSLPGQLLKYGSPITPKKLVVLLPSVQLQYIIAHATTTYPEECCGFLIGTNRHSRTIYYALATPNAARPSRIRRYSIDASEIIRAQKVARSANLDLIGVYHSHPDAPVEPSQFDLDYAQPNFVYLVISLNRGEPLDLGAWLLSQTEPAFELEELKVF
jgi:proteasome lid subunit RPN8/RPN11